MTHALMAGTGLEPSLTSGRLPVYRPSAFRIRALIDTGERRDREIGELLQVDPILSLGLLREANRTVSGLGGSVTSVPTALEVLGQRIVRQLVDAALSLPPSPVQERVDVLGHSIVASLAAEALAAMLGTVDPAEARAAGLLHDVAFLCGEDGAVPHAEQGARLLRNLGLPPHFLRAVAAHHEPANAVLQCREEEHVLCSVVMLADRLAATLGAPLATDRPSEDEESGSGGRVGSLEGAAQERVAREVADALLVLGLLLGEPGLDVASLKPTLVRLASSEPRAPRLPGGLTRELQRALTAIREAGTEAGALAALLWSVRASPAVARVVLVLEATGEAMLSGSEDPLPFFTRAADVAEVAEGVGELLLLVQREGRAAVVRRGMGFDGSLMAFGAEELLVVPIRAGSQPVGTLLVPGAEPFQDGLPAAFDVLSHATGEAVERAQLARRSFLLSERMTKDGLTGVLQRAHVMDLLESEIRAANRWRRLLALVMIDIDDFKGWNDAFGHQVGDTLLRDVARVICDCSRDADIVGRYGGDEFMVLLPGSTVEQARAYAERIRWRIQELGAIMKDVYDRPLSTSLGVAAVDAWPVEAETLLFRADHALYRAKERGRNCVHAEQRRE